MRILHIVYAPSNNSENLSFDMKPYGILSDKDGNFNFLVGYSRLSEGKDPYVPGSFRISRILSIKLHGKSFGSGRITKEQETELKKRIQERGVEYLYARQEDTVIRLSAEGKRKFDYTVLQRPLPISEKTRVFPDGSVELHFSATVWQIRNYFFKFGKEAKVLSPKELAEDFRREYEEALERYLENS